MSIKKIVLILAVIIVVILAIPVIVLLSVDVNHYKDDIAELVQKQTGRELQIEGDISKSFFPWFGVSINGLSMGNPEGFQGKFLSVGRFALKVKFWPLFSGNVEIDAIELDKLTLNLLQQPGQNNWTFGTLAEGESGEVGIEGGVEGGAPPQPAPEPESKLKTPAAEGGFALKGVSLAGVRISDANISFEDQINKLKFAANDINITLSQFRFGQDAKLRLNLKASSENPKMQAKLKLDSILNINPENKRYASDIKSLKITLNSDMVSKQPVTLELSGKTEFDANKGLLHVPALTLKNEELNVTLSAEQIQATPPGFKGNINLAPLDLQKYLPRYGIALPPSIPRNKLNKFSLKTRYLLDLDHAALREIGIQLDESKLTGNIEHVQFSPFSVRWALTLDRFNLDEYFPPPPKPAKGTKEKAKSKAKTEAPTNAPESEVLPLDMIAGINLDGTIKVDWLQVRSVPIEKSKISIKATDGKVKLQLNTQSIAQGSVDAKVDMTVAGQKADIQSDVQLTKVNAGEIVQKMLQTDVISGSNLRLDSKLNTQGNTVSAWQKGLNGTVSLNMEDGAFHGINVMANIIEKYEKYLKRDFPKQEIENRTLFQVVTAELSAKNGVFTSKKLLARSPELSADGNATIDLPKARMDLKMLIQGKKFPPFIAKSDAENLKTVKFPFTMDGPFDNLKTEFDYISPLKGLLKQQAKKKIEQVKEKQKEKLQKRVDEIKETQKEKLKNKLKDRLKGLF